MTKSGQFGRNDSIVVEQKAVYKGFFEMREYKLKHRLFAGGWSSELTRELFYRESCTAVLMYDPDQAAVVLIEQFRIGALDHARSPWLLELVAGINEPGETPEQVALRETQEEANAAITRLIPIYNFLLSPGGTNERVYLFCGIVNSQRLGGVHGLVSEHEDIRVHVMPLQQAWSLVESGEIDNAITIIALQWLKLRAGTF